MGREGNVFFIFFAVIDNLHKKYTSRTAQLQRLVCFQNLMDICPEKYLKNILQLHLLQKKGLNKKEMRIWNPLGRKGVPPCL